MADPICAGCGFKIRYRRDGKAWCWCPDYRKPPDNDGDDRV